MKLAENKSEIWYKVLYSSGHSFENSHEKWPLPVEGKKGDWHTSACQAGTLLVTNPKPFYMPLSRVFIVELDKEQPLAEAVGLVWVRRVRLVREATNRELSSMGIYRTFGPLF